MFSRKRADNANSTILLPPKPYPLTPSGDFDGNDGKWSTFYINLGDDGTGSHGQNFKVVPSTSSPVVLVPGKSDWCSDDCAEKRGIMPFNGDKSEGFDSSASKAWKDAGLYAVPLPDWWSGGSLNGSWGSENIGLGESSTKSDIVPDSFVVAYTFKDFFLGSFGLAAGAVNPGSGAKSPFISSFSGYGKIASVSYGYSAGAFYKNGGKGAVGSLVLGGYDRSRLKMDGGVSIQMPNEKNNTLLVGVQSILYKPDQNVEANTFSFTQETKGFSARIDSTLPYLWLPDAVCDHFAERFQLTYDDKANLYKVNASAHQHNQQQNATVSFKIGDGPKDSNTYATINLPYDAFDLQIDSPIVENRTDYFPLKKSPNGIFVLGRTFLQESYIIVDYERANFTVAPAVFSESNSDQNLVTIFNKTYVPPQPNSTPPPSGGGGLAPGAVAGIVVGVVVILFAAAAGAFFWWKRRRAAQKSPPYTEKPTEIDTMVAGTEVKHRRVSELDSEPPGSPKPSVGGYYGDRDQKDAVAFPPISEMDSPPAELYSPPPLTATPHSEGGGSDYFIAGNKVRRRGATRESSGNNSPGNPALYAAPLAELPGDTGTFQELPGDDGKLQRGGLHLEPGSSGKGGLGQSRGPSDSSLKTNIDEVMRRPSPSPEPPAEKKAEVKSQAASEKPKEKAIEEVDEPKETEGETGTEAAPERRPSHTRGLSDTTIHSDSTAVSQPSPEELERWRTEGHEDGPRRPLSE